MMMQNLERTAASMQSKTLRVGFDIVEVFTIEQSFAEFGERFCQRLFTIGEIEYSRRGQDDVLFFQRLAARFAAKEATIKALRLSELGIGWRDIEVCKQDDGSCELLLHGRVAEIAEQVGVRQVALSMSHDGAYAGALVVMHCIRID
jgi:holo-[acyl-carrier protein] synthase